MSRDLLPESDHVRTDHTVSTSPVASSARVSEYAEPAAVRVVTAEPLAATPVVPVASTPVVPVATAPHVVHRTTVRRAIALDAVLAAAAGIVILVVGLLAVVRAGIDGPLSDPVVEVAGFTHTATLGIVEVVAGLGLLIAGVSRSRSACAFWGVVLGIAGFIGAVQAESFRDSLALESSMGWLALVIGAAVALAALLLPRRTHTASMVDAA